MSVDVCAHNGSTPRAHGDSGPCCAPGAVDWKRDSPRAGYSRHLCSTGKPESARALGDTQGLSPKRLCPVIGERSSNPAQKIWSCLTFAANLSLGWLVMFSTSFSVCPEADQRNHTETPCRVSCSGLPAWDQWGASCSGHSSVPRDAKLLS